ncbi:hypothetical protein AAC387_Pa06g1923 [Persea americana]
MKQKNNASIKSTKPQKQASHKENKFHVLHDLDGASSASDSELHETYVGTGCSNIAHCNPVKIWLCWSPKINVKILEESSQHVHCRISHFDNCYNVAVCYGPISVQDRQQLWNNLNLIASSSNSPWLVLGDFNAVRCEQEKSGRAKPNLVSMESSNNCLGSCALEDSHL